MKKLVCILLAMLTFAFPALAEEENPFAPFALTAPEGVNIEIGEGSCTFVSGMTRVVTIVIERVPDEDPAVAILRLMTQFDPDAVIGEDIPAGEGMVAVQAVSTDKYGKGVDALTVMLLSDQGHLLILSGYDMEGDEEAVQSMLDALLDSVTVDGVKIALTEE